MTFTVEVLLKETDRVVSETVHLDCGPEGWTEDVATGVLRAMLGAIARAKDPATGERAVALRGLSWIVERVRDGVMIAIEIPSGAVVAGPFQVAQERLDGLVGRAIAAAGPAPASVH